MDILDIDEALKDDSYMYVAAFLFASAVGLYTKILTALFHQYFSFLADKTHDDISNILHQWKTNNQQQSHLQPTNEECTYIYHTYMYVCNICQPWVI